MSTPLAAITEAQSADTSRARPVAWYRTSLDSHVRMELHERSDCRGWLQTLGCLIVFATTGGLAFYSTGRWPWWATVLLVFPHGTCCSFVSNAVHELGHGTVFRTRFLNAWFERVFGFLSWMNFHMFDTSHVRHHQFTLHPPHDLEVVLPIKLVLRNFLQEAFLNWPGFKLALTVNSRIARGRFRGEW